MTGHVSALAANHGVWIGAIEILVGIFQGHYKDLDQTT